MIDHRPIVKNITLASFIFLLLGFAFSANGQTDAAAGKALFSSKCATCHGIDKAGTGPALRGIEARVPDRKKLHAWIKNNQAVLKSGDKYFTDLYNAWAKTPMNLFPELEDADIENILTYIKTAPAPKDPNAGTAATAAAAESDNSLVFGIITLILAVITLILLQVNANLRKLADDREGIPGMEPIPFYRNKTYIALATILLFVVGGYYTIQGAIGLGRTKDYQPEQPIYFSHKIHAGVNQINCMYCHNSVWDSKHATIPSINVCMNCHQNIKQYEKSGPIYYEDGREVNGNAELQKLFKYAGYDVSKNEPWDPSKAKPIEWVKIHNLPDHVYFNHSQHVRAGKVQCQTCHGEINKMDEVKQFADLSMGWCINCHRTSKVDFPDSTGANGNRFYSIYEKYHNDLKSGKKDSITVNDIGGLECQKCHY